MSKVKIAVLESQVNRLLEKQKELTERVRANEKVVAAIGLLGSVVIAILGTGIFQKAEACSPRLDGEPTYCPDWDDVLERPVAVSTPEEEEDPYTHRVTLYDTRVAHMGHSFPTDGWIQKMRDWQSQQDRMSIDEMLNSALEDMEDNNGRNGSTEQEELLQLPSNGD